MPMTISTAGGVGIAASDRLPVHAVGVGFEYRLLESWRLCHTLFQMTAATLHFLGVFGVRQLGRVDVAMALCAPEAFMHGAVESIEVDKHALTLSVYIETVQVGLTMALLT